MISVRVAVPDDAPAILRVRLDSWEAAYGPYLPPHVWAEQRRAADPARLTGGIADGLRGLVAEVDATIRGYVFHGPSRDDDLAGTTEIFAIYADPRSWSTGVGRALMTAAIDAIGTRPITLWVLEVNDRARRFYERAGFAADGARQQAHLPASVELPEVRYRLG